MGTDYRAAQPASCSMPVVYSESTKKSGGNFRLKRIMNDIHRKCVDKGREPDGTIHYVKGANIAGFIKIADTMPAYGAV